MEANRLSVATMVLPDVSVQILGRAWLLLAEAQLHMSPFLHTEHLNEIYLALVPISFVSDALEFCLWDEVNWKWHSLARVLDHSTCTSL